MRNCIDLKKVFGREYRVGRDPAYYAEYGKNARTHDPWYWQILCQHGHIYPQGDNKLGASTDRHGAIATRLTQVPGIQIVQEGSDGINVVFASTKFEQVAEVLKPRRRRRLSAAHRASLRASAAAALKRYRNCRADISSLRPSSVPNIHSQVDQPALSAV